MPVVLPDLVQTLTFRLQSLPTHGRLFTTGGVLLTAADIAAALASPNLIWPSEVRWLIATPHGPLRYYAARSPPG
jgi:hypothetical protein